MYEFDDIDRAVLANCRKAVNDNDKLGFWLLDEDDTRAAVALLTRVTRAKPPTWPRRYKYMIEANGYVVWRDVFEGDMRCSLDEAVMGHRIATFICESDAVDYCAFCNEMNADAG